MLQVTLIIGQVLDHTLRMKFNLLFNFLRACEAGEDGSLQLKPSLHITAAHLHCVWECLIQPIKLIPFIHKLVRSQATSVAFQWTVCAVPLCDVLSIS